MSESKLNNPWLFITHDPKNIESMPRDRDFEILFDNGYETNFNSDSFPFATIIAWREIEEKK